jgi:hypothetical protein
VVDHHHRRVVAGREAFFFALQIEAAVRRALADFDAEPLLDVRLQLIAAAQHAGDVGAHRDPMPANGLGLEHRIERRDFVDLDRRQAEIIGNRIHRLPREIARVVLHGSQCCEHRGALAIGWKLADPLIDLVAHVL